MVLGSVPGSKGAWVTVKDSVKKLGVTPQNVGTALKDEKVETANTSIAENGEK